MGCPTQFNYTKFGRLNNWSARFCIEPEDYVIEGNFDQDHIKAIQLNVDRCKPTAT